MNPNAVSWILAGCQQNQTPTSRRTLPWRPPQAGVVLPRRCLDGQAHFSGIRRRNNRERQISLTKLKNWSKRKTQWNQKHFQPYLCRSLNFKFDGERRESKTSSSTRRFSSFLGFPSKLLFPLLLQLTWIFRAQQEPPVDDVIIITGNYQTRHKRIKFYNYNLINLIHL